MDKYINIISNIRELSKSERIIFEKTHGENLQNFSKEVLKNHSELYEFLTSLSSNELLFIYKLAFADNSADIEDKCFYINTLFNCFDLDKYLPDTSSDKAIEQIQAQLKN